MRRLEDYIAILLVVAGAFAVVSLSTCKPAEASEIPQEVKAIIGEAIGQSDKEILAHCHALRNRGTLKGVYGLNNWHKHNTPKNVARVTKLWIQSGKEADFTKGCNHWLSDYDLTHYKPKLMAWRFKADYSVKVGSTTFYRL